MTENRFEYTAYDDGTEAIYDRKKDKLYFDMQLSNIEELLNELNDENERLHEENQQLTEIKEILNNLNSMDCYWDSAILTGVIENIANVIGVDLGE